MSPWRQGMLLSRGRCAHLSSSKASFLPAFLPSFLLPAMPVGTPLLLGGDWNCVAEDLDLVGGQPGTRQHGFQSGLLPFQQALSLQDAFRCLHPLAREFTHTATNNASSARIDSCRCLQMARQRQLASKCQRSFSHRSHPVRALWGGNHGVTFQCTPPRPRALVNASCHHFPSCLQNPHDSSDADLPSG